MGCSTSKQADTRDAFGFDLDGCCFKDYFEDDDFKARLTQSELLDPIFDSTVIQWDVDVPENEDEAVEYGPFFAVSTTPGPEFVAAKKAWVEAVSSFLQEEYLADAIRNGHYDTNNIMDHFYIDLVPIYGQGCDSKWNNYNLYQLVVVEMRQGILETLRYVAENAILFFFTAGDEYRKRPVILEMLSRAKVPANVLEKFEVAGHNPYMWFGADAQRDGEVAYKILDKPTTQRREIISKQIGVQDKSKIFFVDDFIKYVHINGEPLPKRQQFPVSVFYGRFHQPKDNVMDLLKTHIESMIEADGAHHGATRWHSQDVSIVGILTTRLRRRLQDRLPAVEL